MLRPRLRKKTAKRLHEPERKLWNVAVPSHDASSCTTAVPNRHLRQPFLFFLLFVVYVVWFWFIPCFSSHHGVVMITDGTGRVFQAPGGSVRVLLGGQDRTAAAVAHQFVSRHLVPFNPRCEL